ncbi:Uncharacterized protein dnm_071710 [Desulfonema magnum]|uniref:Uncharacterized protein n=1 Tax=Desulfonema magnum TaxID=45655 RepID=A0A975GRI9_9BACT|nr:Uncharacterized protein dnm_071710 [Desulfonema magnum]
MDWKTNLSRSNATSLISLSHYLVPKLCVGMQNRRFAS